MITPFTNSILYIIWNFFESFTIVKPYPSKPHSEVLIKTLKIKKSRYVICHNFLEAGREEVIERLLDFYAKYTNLIKLGKVSFKF